MAFRRGCTPLARVPDRSRVPFRFPPIERLLSEPLTTASPFRALKSSAWVFRQVVRWFDNSSYKSVPDELADNFLGRPWYRCPSPVEWWCAWQRARIARHDLAGSSNASPKELLQMKQARVDRPAFVLHLGLPRFVWNGNRLSSSFRYH